MFIDVLLTSLSMSHHRNAPRSVVQDSTVVLTGGANGIVMSVESCLPVIPSADLEKKSAFVG